MALKKDKQLTGYSAEIGVNRGRGFDFIKQKQQQSTNQLTKLLDGYAETSFKRFTDQQKEYGEELAEQTSLKKTEINVTDPITNEVKTKLVTTGYDTEQHDKILTVSALASFEKSIAADYEKAILADGKAIIEDTTKMFVKNINRFNEGDFTNLVNEQLSVIKEPLNENMEKLFDANMIIEEAQHRNQLVNKKAFHDQQVNGIEFETTLDNLRLSLAENFGNPQEREKITKAIIAHVKKHDETTLQAIALGDEIIAEAQAAGKVYDKLAPYFQPNMIDASLDEKILNVENLNQLDFLLTGSFNQEVELYDFSTGKKNKVITSDLLSEDMNTVQTRKVLRQQVSHLLDIANRNIRKHKTSNVGSNIYNQQMNSNTKTYANNTEFNKWLNDVEGVQFTLNVINNKLGTNYSIEDSQTDPKVANLVLKYNIETQGTPGAFLKKKIKDAFETNNMKAIQELKSLGVLNMLVYAKSQYVSNNISHTEYEVERYKDLFSGTTQHRMKELVDSNEEVRILTERWKKFDEESIPFSDRIKKINIPTSGWFTRNTTEKFTTTSFNEYIYNETVNQLTTNEDFLNVFDKDIENASLISQHIINNIRDDAMDLINSGTILTNDSLPLLVKAGIFKMLESGKVRVSHYGFKDFMPMTVEGQDDTTDIEDRGFLMLNAPEHYSIEDKEKFSVSWDSLSKKVGLDYVEDKIIKMAKDSPEFDIGPLKGRPLEFGRNIKLKPVRGTEDRKELGFPTTYYVIYVDPYNYQQILLTTPPQRNAEGDIINEGGRFLTINLQKERDDFIGKDKE